MIIIFSVSFFEAAAAAAVALAAQVGRTADGPTVGGDWIATGKWQADRRLAGKEGAGDGRGRASAA